MAQWIIVKTIDRLDLYGCSECGHPMHLNKPKYPYCPWCGAKMEEEDETD